MERFFEVGYDFTQILYSIAPKEIWIIVFASIFIFLSLEYQENKDKKNRRPGRLSVAPGSTSRRTRTPFHSTLRPWRLWTPTL